MLPNLRKKIREGSHMQSVRLDEVDEHVCLNCGTRFRGDFCPACKQKASTKRLNLKDTCKGIISKFITLDSGLLHTVIDLICRPGYMVRDYIRGYRTEYVEPLMLLIILLAVEYLTSSSSETLDSGLSEELLTLLAAHPVSLTIAKAMHWIAGDEQRMIVACSFLLGMALSSTLWIIRVGKEHLLNVSESIHLILYWFCNGSIWGIFIDLIALTLPSSWYLSEEAVMPVWTVIVLVVFVFMVRYCTQISWKRMMLFVPTYTVLTFIYILLFVLILLAIIAIDVPFSVIREHDLLRQILA